MEFLQIVGIVIFGGVAMTAGMFTQFMRLLQSPTRAMTDTAITTCITALIGCLALSLLLGIGAVVRTDLAKPAV